MRIAGCEFGPALVKALRGKPIGGRAQFMTAFRILKSCGFLQNEGLSFSAWIEREGLLGQLAEQGWEPGNYREHRSWRKEWSRASSQPWGVPHLVDHIEGIGPDTFEYILRDLACPGSLNLFKVDSTNHAFVKGSSLSNHVPGECVGSKPDRKEYWQSLYDSGSLASFPPAVINIAIYWPISQLEEIWLMWEDNDGNLVAYDYLPAQLKDLNSKKCIGGEE